MIIKGNPAGNVGFWSKHLLRDDTNARVEVKEISGLLADNLPSALHEMQAVASGSRSHGNFMYQANISPRVDEHLTPEQWKEAVDTLEKNLGLEGHQRVVIEHEKEGRTHRHVVWNRVDVETLRVTDMTGNWRIHTATARELEQMFDLTPSPTPTSIHRKAGLELWEIRAAERSGIDPADVKAELTDLWRSTDSGRAFAAAIEQHGYVLAKGDRRDFCIIDQAGDVHSLARRLDGVTAADVRERMVDVDREALPSVADARALQHERFPHGAAGRSDQEQERGNAEAELAHVGEPKGASGMSVVNTATGVAEGLVDFVAGLLGGGTSTPPQDPATRDAAAEIRAQRKALAALENLRESMERGDRLNASDIRHLTPEHLQNIYARGDDALRELIERMEERRQRERDYGRERER
jgi:hypothetical protein